MDKLATPHTETDLGTVLCSLVADNGSFAITGQLRRFIDTSRDPNGLRQRTNILRPALIADIAHFMCVSHVQLSPDDGHARQIGRAHV